MRVRHLPAIWRSKGGGRWLALALLALYMLSTGGDLFISDGEVMLKTTAELAFARRIALQPDPGLPQIVPGRNGRYFSKYGLGQPLAALPFFRLGTLLAQSSHNPMAGDRLVRLSVISCNAVVSAGAALLLYLLARRLYGPPAALMLAALYGLATPAWPYSKIYFSEPLLTFCLLLATLATLYSVEATASGTGSLLWAGLAGSAAGYAMLTKPLAGVALPVFALYVALAHYTRPHGSVLAFASRLLLFAMGAAPLIGLTFFHNWYRFGSFLDNGYSAERFSTPFYIGLYGLLFSSGRGLLWYAPPIMLGLMGLRRAWQHKPSMLLLCAALVLPPLLMTARWWAWHSGWGWGPRLIMPYVPFVLLAGGAILQAGQGWRLAWLLLAAGALIQIPGVAVNFNQYMGGVVLPSPVGQQLATPGVPQQPGTLQETLPYLLPDDLAYSIPDYSPILGQTRMLLRGEGLFVHSFDLGTIGIPAPLATAYPLVWLGALLLSLALLVHTIITRYPASRITTSGAEASILEPHAAAEPPRNSSTSQR